MDVGNDAVAPAGNPLTLGVAAAANPFAVLSENFLCPELDFPISPFPL
jgi:hypothetical protein